MKTPTKRNWVNSNERLTQSDNLSEPFINSVTKREDFKIGIEVEQFLVSKEDFKALPYSSRNSSPDIAQILRLFSEKHNWEAILEKDNIIALKQEDFTITLEPGGALEFVSAPYRTVHEIASALEAFENDFKKVLIEAGAESLRLGYLPFDTVDTVGLVPKSRYDFMYDYMPEVGGRGREMMKLTSSIQLSIDYQNEADCMKKMKLAALATPIFIALSANSKVINGKASDNLSERSAVWEDTDNSRCGLPEFQFKEKPLFSVYVDWALKIPVYFIVRDNKQVFLSGLNFSEFLEGKHSFKEGTSNPYPILADWEQHISTLFPWVRLRHYIEIRSFDMGTMELQLAASSLVKGLFNCERSLHELESLTKDLNFPKTIELTKLARENGLEAGHDNIQLKELALKACEVAKKCLIRCDKGEEKYLDYFFDKIKNWNYEKEIIGSDPLPYIKNSIF